MDSLQGRYEIIKEIGSGGMGVVYLAKSRSVGNLWAIKRILKKEGADFDFLAEPNILKKLSHPALPRIVDIFEDEKAVYIVEDYIAGQSLDKQLQVRRSFDEATVIEWSKQLCRVLMYLHHQTPNPIIYRDMKPANIIADSDNVVRLIDFGIAREYKTQGGSDTSYAGTSGFLWGNGSFFYGQCDEDGYPHGKGIYVVVHTGGFGNASLGYNWYDGEWDHGTIVGEAKIWDEFTKSWTPDLQGRHGRKEITCTFGEDEIMTDATFIETIYGNGAFHQVTFHIVNGKYVPSEWGGNYNRTCELHSDCGITFGVTEFGSELYRNPFSFVREEDIDFPKLYGGWNLSFGGLRD